MAAMRFSVKAMAMGAPTKQQRCPFGPTPVREAGENLSRGKPAGIEDAHPQESSWPRRRHGEDP